MALGLDFCLKKSVTWTFSASDHQLRHSTVLSQLNPAIFDGVLQHPDSIGSSQCSWQWDVRELRLNMGQTPPVPALDHHLSQCTFRRELLPYFHVDLVPALGFNLPNVICLWC